MLPGTIGTEKIKKLQNIRSKILPPHNGTFILSEEIRGKGVITEICALGVIDNKTASSNSTDDIKGTLDILIIEHINNNSWKIRTRDKFYQDFKAKNQKHCKNSDLNLIGKKVMKGDRVAVHVPSHCVYNKSMTHEYCPLQIKHSGNDDVKVIDWAYSFDNLSEGEVLQIEMNKQRHKVGFNFQMKYCFKKG